MQKQGSAAPTPTRAAPDPWSPVVSRPRSQQGLLVGRDLVGRRADQRLDAAQAELPEAQAEGPQAQTLFIGPMLPTRKGKSRASPKDSAVDSAPGRFRLQKNKKNTA